MIFHFAANKVIDEITQRATNADFGSNLYIGLSTTEPVANGANITEPNTNGYARVFLGQQGQTISLKFPAAVNGSSTNSDTIFFPKATGAWGTITHAVLFTAATGGSPIISAALTTPIAPVANEVAIIEPGNLVITLE